MCVSEQIYASKSGTADFSHWGEDFRASFFTLARYLPALWAIWGSAVEMGVEISVSKTGRRRDFFPTDLEQTAYCRSRTPIEFNFSAWMCDLSDNRPSVVPTLRAEDYLREGGLPAWPILVHVSFYEFFNVPIINVLPDVLVDAYVGISLVFSYAFQRSQALFLPRYHTGQNECTTVFKLLHDDCSM